jgi:hypothetical protein
MSAQTRLAAITSALEGLIEELDDITFEELRSAAASGERQRPRSDRRLTQARRALEKAHHLLDEDRAHDD